jgi:queuine tRNA-ribosyltransferase
VPPTTFTITATNGHARAGLFATPHGAVNTPAFMPVGTLATVKALDPAELRSAGVEMLLGNAYHLHLRPGDETVRDLGGLHSFMGWNGPILTDSGGFQVFSLASLRDVSEDGVRFRSHIDGSERLFTPESVTEIQINLGADIIMQFDHVIPGDADESTARDASERSLRWLERCAAEFSRRGDPARQALFPIVQGGVHAALRRDAARSITAMGDWPGCAVGGLSVGEEKAAMYDALATVNEALPRDKPRYLMGVGFPEDLIEGIARGMDMFDCVAPTRMGRNGTAFTNAGRVNVRGAALRNDNAPLDADCECSTCTRFSRAYLRHLFVSDEMLGPRLLSLHNVHFLVTLMRAARQAIVEHSFEGWRDEWLRRSSSAPPDSQ